MGFPIINNWARPFQSLGLSGGSFPSGFTDIKKPNVLHLPVQAKSLHFNHYIYI